MKDYFSHSAYNRWYRQYSITLNQVRAQLDALRLPIELIPFPEPVRHLLESEIDEIDIEIEKIIPRNFVHEKPLETREVFIENLKVMVNFVLRFFHSKHHFASIYEHEKKTVLAHYQESNIKGKLINFRRHIDEAVVTQMKTAVEPSYEAAEVQLANIAVK